MRWPIIAVSVALTALGGCRPGTVAPPDDRPTQRSPGMSAAFSEQVEAAGAGVSDARLREILRDHWATSLRRSPRWATRLGVHDFDDRLGEHGPAARARARADRRRWLDALATIDDRSLSSRDAETKALLVATLQSQERVEVCDLARWRVSANTNPVEWIGNLPRELAIGSVEDADHLLSRYGDVASSVDAQIEDLRSGLADGKVADAESIRRVLDMVQRQLDTPTPEWSALEMTKTWPASIPSAERARLNAAFIEVVQSQIRPAVVRFRDLLRDELLAAGRPDDRAGVSEIADGATCYAALIEEHTSLPLSAQEVHETGLAEIARIDGELAALGRKALGTEDLAATLARLRADPSLYFDTPEAVQDAAVQALARAKSAMPDFFGRLPRADCVVERVPAYKAPFTYIGYYEPPHPDGSKPGEYFINVLDPHTRPRFEARVLAVHESIPGHHLQIAIAQELDELPAFRRHEGYNSFVEGWALYTERLADEMGLYETDLDRLGMLSFDAWRAGRLVVDTGIHAKGWTRAQAEAFLAEHTALALNNITNEVDRYVGWPGQALGYKIGQLEILALRRRARAALGEAFSLPAFHDAVLEGGALPLAVLRTRVQAWIDDRSSDRRSPPGFAPGSAPGSAP